VVFSFAFDAFRKKLKKLYDTENRKHLELLIYLPADSFDLSFSKNIQTNKKKS
jgi:hypothetical protein